MMLLLETILLRPYVFLFFLAYLLGCSLHMGAGRAVLFAVVGYGIAWVSEFSSIHTGFPYGWYYYLEHTRGRELWVLGVPFMDSLSYVFLAYASFSLALFLAAPLGRVHRLIYVLETRRIRHSLFTAFLGTLLFVYLDIIIDPVALQGDRWFLGLLYGYPEGGTYFGVPLTNFAGWFATGFLLIFSLQRLDRMLPSEDSPGRRYPWRFLIGPLLYCSVVVFNLAVTFFIGDYLLAWVGIFIVLLPSFLAYTLIRIRLSAPAGEREWAAHCRDFPEGIPRKGPATAGKQG